MKLLRYIDAALNKITMYRLTLYGLALLAFITVLMAFQNLLPFTGITMLVSLGLCVVSCYGANIALSKLLHITSNSESALITSLILYMILVPASDLASGLVVVLAGLLAMASKYLLQARGRHIFNPAAFGLAVVSISGLSFSRWWIGSSILLPFVAVLGLLVVRKTRKFTVTSAFIATALLTMLVASLGTGRSATETISLAFASWPLVFLGSIMLTEPSTLPGKPRQQLINAVIVGLIFSSQTSIGPISSTPEVALLAGNLYALAATPSSRMRLTLIRRTKLAENIYNFEFEPDKKRAFQAGQYVELTLPLKSADDRGNRRSFTIASAPSESTIAFGIKFYKPSSAFKRALQQLEPGADISANHITGSFTLPYDRSRKLAFIAGGIGITPFRSQLAQLMATGQKRDITLFYLVSKINELSYKDVLDNAAKQLGIKVIPIVADPADAAWSGLTGPLTTDILRQHLPDYAERLFYVSGPNRMVDATTASLKQLGVAGTNIKTDHFSGY